MRENTVSTAVSQSTAVPGRDLRNLYREMLIGYVLGNRRATNGMLKRDWKTCCSCSAFRHGKDVGQPIVGGRSALPTSTDIIEKASIRSNWESETSKVGEVDPAPSRHHRSPSSSAHLQRHNKLDFSAILFIKSAARTPRTTSTVHRTLSPSTTGYSLTHSKRVSTEIVRLLLREIIRLRK